MRRVLRWMVPCLIFSGVLGTGEGYATSFSREGNFLAALPSSGTTLTFDSLTPGTILSGITVQGITFPTQVTDPFGADHRLSIIAHSANNPTRAGVGNALGTNDTLNFNTIQALTPLTLHLTDPAQAIGMFFITPDTLQNEDILLQAGGTTASLTIADRTFIGPSNGADYFAYFLGVISSTTFTTATIAYGVNVDSGVPFLYNIDDITTAPWFHLVSDSTWKSLGLMPNESLPAGWEQPGFNDAMWPTACAPYPSRMGYPPTLAIPGTTAQYMWYDPQCTSDGQTGLTESLFRKTFTLPSTGEFQGIAHVAADDDYEFFVNGTRFILNANGGTDQHRVGNIPDAPLAQVIDFSSALHPGMNVLALHAVDGGFTGVDSQGNPIGHGYDRLYEWALIDAQITGIPEPSTWLLLTTGLASLLAVRVVISMSWLRASKYKSP